MSNCCNLMDCSRLGSSVHGISQARTLEWVTLSFSRGSFQPKDQICIFCMAGGFFIAEPPGKPKEEMKLNSRGRLLPVFF